MARAGDPKVSVRLTPENYAWLVAAQRRSGAQGVGTVIGALVTAARLAEGAGSESEFESAVSTLVNGGEVVSGVVPGQVTIEEALEASGAGEQGPPLATAGSTGGAGTVPGGAAPAPRPGVAPVPDLAQALLESLADSTPVPRCPPPAAGARRKLSRLDVVVARVLSPGAGQIAPVDRARAIRLIKAGKVEVSGVGPGEVLEPSRLVGPGEVVVHP